MAVPSASGAPSVSGVNVNLGSFRQCTPPEGSDQEDAPLTFSIWQTEVSVFGVGVLKELLMSGKAK